MYGYKFYVRDSTNNFQLIGVVPERRKNAERITDESIVNLGRIYFGINAKYLQDMFFVETVLLEPKT